MPPKLRADSLVPATDRVPLELDIPPARDRGPTEGWNKLTEKSLDLAVRLSPEVVKRHWWQHLLHKHRSERLRSAHLRSGDKRRVLINVP